MGNVDDANINGKEIQYESNNFALSGKIMLIAIVALVIVIVVMLCLHAYVRWHLLRARRQQQIRRTRRPQFVFYVDPAAPISLTRASRGLRPSVIATLPVFTFSPSTHPDPVECSVCLSEFENGETGRVLPKCNHSFHTQCIDMWFKSHSTCPLCRAPVEPQPEVAVTEPGSSSALCVECQIGGEEPNRSERVGSSSLHVEVPARNENLGHESQSSFRSPVSRILSFKRILTREKKATVSGSVEGCSSSMTELDVERGEETR